MTDDRRSKVLRLLDREVAEVREELRLRSPMLDRCPQVIVRRERPRLEIVQPWNVPLPAPPSRLSATRVVVIGVLYGIAFAVLSLVAP